MAIDPFTAPLNPGPIGFTGSLLDRADALRRDHGALDRMRFSPAARFLPFENLEPFLARSSGGPGLQWVELSHVPGDLPWVFLGLLDGQPHFALSVPQGMPLPGEKTDMRAAAAQLPDGLAAILAQGRSLLAWHEKHGHCAVCGAETRPAKGGYQRVCEVCKAEHFPRTDPVVIMLVVDGERCLLGRNARFPPGWYSTLAGFVEPGESVEEAVAREVWEEAGVRAGRVRYVASQPWPFPSSLMIGCFAEALTTELTVDATELEDAKWFTRDEARAALAGDGVFKCSPPLAISHSLLKTWAQL
jgi:NAD+ diphosphatase